MKSKSSLYNALFVALLLLVVMLSAGELEEESTIDSLLVKISVSEGWDLLRSYAELTYYLKDSSPEECIVYCDEFFDYIKTIDVTTIDKDKYIDVKSSVYFNKGSALSNLSKYSEAIQNLQLSLEGFEDSIKLASVYERIGSAYYYLSRYNDAMDNYLKGLTSLEDDKEHDLYGKIINNLAVVFQASGNTDQALEYFKMSLEYKKKSQNIEGEAINLMNIGIIHRRNGDYERAEGYYLQALSKAEQADATNVAAKIYNNMGSLYFVMEKYEEADNYYQTSLSLRKKLDNAWGLANIYSNITELKLHITPEEDFESIRSWADSALVNAEYTSSYNLMCRSYRNYSKLEKGLGNSKASFLMMKKCYAYLDSIRDFDQTKEILEMEGLLTHQTKTSQILMYEKMNAQNKLELHKSNLRVITVSIILIFTVSLTIILFFIYRNNRKFRTEIITINNEVETANEQLKRRISELEEFKDSLTEKFQKTIDDIHTKDNLLIIQSRYVALSDMIESISMKWKSNLHKIEEHVVLLKKLYDNNELDQAHLESISSSSMEILNDMSIRIDDFRDFFRPQKAKVYFYVKDVISKAVGFVIDYYREKNISIDIEGIGDDIRIDGYSNELALIVLNIINNSLDAFIARNIKDANITISAETNFGRVILNIQDNAGGVPEEIIDKIFEAFVTKKSDPDSNGLGLYIAREIVRDRFNGTISVSNESGGVLVKIIV